MVKYFVVSDIHGFLKELKDNLRLAGFQKQNKEHILVVCGDVFDRGPDNVGVYNFIMSVPKKRRILIKGNHEALYLALLKKNMPEAYDFSNCTVDTFCQIAGYDKGCLDYKYHSCMVGDFETWGKSAKTYWDQIVDIVKNHKITAWLQSDEWLDYYELDNYIFVHSFIPLHSKDGLPGYYIYDKELEYFPSWRTEATPAEWEDSRWGCPWKNYKDGLFKDEEQKGKTLVCGHWHVSDFWAKLGNWPIDGTESNIYYSKGIIGIDCGVFVDYRGFERTFIHPQEVLVIDNNICYDKYGVKLEE